MGFFGNEFLQIAFPGFLLEKYNAINTGYRLDVITCFGYRVLERIKNCCTDKRRQLPENGYCIDIDWRSVYFPEKMILPAKSKLSMYWFA